METDTANRASLLGDYCRRVFPTIREPRVVDLTRISDGWECDVFGFALEGTDSTGPRRDELILRIYLGAEARSKASHEEATLRRLVEVGYPVPRVRALAIEDSPFGQPFVLMEKIDGPLLGDILARATDPEERRADLDLFCRLLVDLHALDWRQVIPSGPRFRPDHLIDDWLAWARGFVREMGATDLDATLAWLAAHRDAVPPRALAVIHHDFHPWNVLLRSNGAPAVIDWTSAEVTDARFDLAWTLLLVQTGLGPATRAAVLAGYERLAGEPVEGLAFFEVSAAVRRLASILISLRGGAAKLGLRPGAEAKMTATRTHLATAATIVRERTGLLVPAVEALLDSAS